MRLGNHILWLSCARGSSEIITYRTRSETIAVVTVESAFGINKEILNVEMDAYVVVSKLVTEGEEGSTSVHFQMRAWRVLRLKYLGNRGVSVRNSQPPSERPEAPDLAVTIVTTAL
jgi:hypothetical protein